MIATGNVKIALDSIRTARWRSLLTMSGVIIGVVSVVTIVSIGEGVKHQITDQIDHFGSDLITVRPGKAVTRDSQGQVSSVNLLSAFAGGTLSETDLNTVATTPGVGQAVPLGFVSAVPEVDNKSLPGTLLVATSSALPQMLNQKVEYGAFFGDDTNKAVAVVGRGVAENLLEEQVPIGRSLQIRGQSFVIVGVFEDFEASPLNPLTDYDNAIFIPSGIAKRLAGGSPNIQQILVKPLDQQQTATVAKELESKLRTAHAGQDDVSVLQQEDSLAIADSVLSLLTRLISGIAAISLLVGGIGIMNVMLVSVTERTHEIGIRKAVGATNNQILGQFVIEAAVISSMGGVVGVALSLLINGILSIATDIEPVLTLPVVVLAVGVSVLVGIIFGVAPALKAAHKDPIEALRQR